MQLRGALLGIALAACGGDDTQDGTLQDAPGASEPALLVGITAAHNQIRANVATATPLPPLEWDPALAATAAAWVAMCRDQDAPTGLIDHNAGRSMGAPYYVGENVFGAGGPPSPGVGEQAVTLWASEAKSYDYAANTCNGNCGHYTQIVWRATLKLGCAVGECPNLAYKTALVCDYGPGGNVSNQRPY